MDSKLPNLIDKHVGRRLRWRRRELHLSQEKLAEMLGVTFQQIQKYERGANRISAGRLFELAQALDASIAYFYEGADEVNCALARGVAEGDEAPEFTGLIDADAVDLVIAFQSIPDEGLRRSILAMVRNSASAFASAGGTKRDPDAPPGKSSQQD
ncbi:helix-turn-helix domain-containing protein [bacterium]|nr:helix-turn-helix domain-containing protein [bacterium]